ncbi:MAG: hypothetical protein ACXVA9_04325 [Bdellovibrionales bacterium]
MISVFEEYKQLWPESSLKEIKPLLSKVNVLHYPRDQRMIGNVTPENVVVVTERNLYDGNIPIFEAGFEHCVQSGREDFAPELLASSLMALRPAAFMKNPITFFFNGFQSSKAAAESGRHVRYDFTSSVEKDGIIKRLDQFLDYNNQMASLKDICLQTADEMITNALFHAPVRASGLRPNSKLARDGEATMPTGKHGTLFACFSDQRVIIGCTDPFGSLEKLGFLLHLRSIFKESAANMRVQGESAGIGFKYLIESAANVYVLVTKKKQTLIACGFLLKGLKANSTASKHLHFSFR